MNLAQWISAPFSQPKAVVPTTATPVLTSPIKIADDGEAQAREDREIFAHLLRITERNGCDLTMTLSALEARHPAVALATIKAGITNARTYGQAVGVLRTYEDTGVAVLPSTL